jgi:hypothetical protein
MRVLIACEFSGIVRDAFIAKGHDAMSCDLLPTEKPGPHYQGDVLEILDDGWDMMIAHPPCTYLSYAAMRVWNNPGRAEKRQDAIEFVEKLWNAPIAKIAIENPKGELIKWRRQDQIINPFDFGEAIRKPVYLWLKNIPVLMLGISVEVKPIRISEKGKKIYFCDNVSGWNKEKQRKDRSRFFPGIAAAMAEQWG